MDAPALLVSIVGLSGAAAVIGRLFAHRMNALIGRERADFESRISAETVSLQEASIKAFRSGMKEAREQLDRDPEDSPEDEGRLNELEGRLTALELDRHASIQEGVEQREYHVQGLTQAKLSFMSAYAFGILGTLVILAGAVKLLFFADGDEQLGIAAFTAVAGAVPEAVAGLLFYAAGQAGTQMSENFDRGRADRDLLAAQTIAAEMEDRELGNRLQALLALKMAESVASEGSLEFLGAPIQKEEKTGEDYS